MNETARAACAARAVPRRAPTERREGSRRSDQPNREKAGRRTGCTPADRSHRLVRTTNASRGFQTLVWTGARPGSVERPGKTPATHGPTSPIPGRAFLHWKDLGSPPTTKETPWASPSASCSSSWATSCSTTPSRSRARTAERRATSSRHLHPSKVPPRLRAPMGVRGCGGAAWRTLGAMRQERPYRPKSERRSPGLCVIRHLFGCSRLTTGVRA